MHGPDVHQSHKRTMSGGTPVRSESRTSWGRGSSQAAHSQTAGPATACEERCASWRPSGSGWAPWCSWGPSAGFHTWTVFCPGPTGGPLCVSDQRPCSNPASSSSLWHWRPTVAWWWSHTSRGSGNPVPRTRIQSRCSWAGETSWSPFEEWNRGLSSDQKDSAVSGWICQKKLPVSVSGFLRDLLCVTAWPMSKLCVLCVECLQPLIVDSLMGPRCLWSWRQWGSSFYKMEQMNRWQQVESVPPLPKKILLIKKHTHTDS